MTVNSKVREMHYCQVGSGARREDGFGGIEALLDPFRILREARLELYAFGTVSVLIQRCWQKRKELTSRRCVRVSTLSYKRGVPMVHGRINRLIWVNCSPVWRTQGLGVIDIVRVCRGRRWQVANRLEFFVVRGIVKIGNRLELLVIFWCRRWLGVPCASGTNGLEGAGNDLSDWKAHTCE